MIRILAIPFSLAVAFSAHAFENPDIQSPEEIAAAHARIERDFAGAIHPDSLTSVQKAKILVRYLNVDPGHLVPTDLLGQALVYFDANKDRFPNQNYIAIVDFSPRSDDYRFFVINMQDGTVQRYHTTHGIGSDPKKSGYASEFGNVINSGKSSLGAARTAEVYVGKFKRALRLDGLDATNSKIRDRAVVVHGWDKVKEAPVIQGLSWGCMTLDWTLKDGVIDQIKEGALLYVGTSKPAS